MRRMQAGVAGLATMGAMLLAVPVTQADTPPPTFGEPSCQGQIVATINHISGVFGPSGNPQASAGPGVFLDQQTPEAIESVRLTYCGSAVGTGASAEAASSAE